MSKQVQAGAGPAPEASDASRDSPPANADLPTEAPRIAVLVHNDAANDSRVLKESASLRGDGARVRIIAVERRLKSRPAGLSTLGPGLELERVREFALERVVGNLRGLLPGGRSAPSSTADGARADEAPTPTADDAAPTRPPSAPAVQATPPLPRRVLADLSERAFRTIELGTFWYRSARAGAAYAPDSVHANDGNTLVPALAIRAAGHLYGRRVGIVYDSHELWRHRNVPPGRLLAPAVDALTEAIGIRRADAVITVSDSIADHLEGEYHLPERPALVRNIPLAGPLPDPATGILRQRAALGAEARVIAYGGRITNGRGIEETIDALAHLPGHVHLVLLGYGEEDYLEQVRSRAAELEVTSRVHLIGAVAPDQVSSALADGDVAVVHVRPICLSYRYALPNKLFESIRAGLPIAAADLPDLRAVVESLGVGEVFSGESPADLAAALLRILEDPEPYRQRARAVAPDLTWEHEAGALLRVHRAVLARVKGKA
jgi:glycosyltransferase involved in cell wall biosynthesis